MNQQFAYLFRPRADGKKKHQKEHSDSRARVPAIISCGGILGQLGLFAFTTLGRLVPRSSLINCRRLSTTSLFSSARMFLSPSFPLFYVLIPFVHNELFILCNIG